MPKSDLERIYSIENLRGIAAVLVLFCHIGIINSYLNLSFTKYFQLGVQLFFAISGFVIPYSMYVNNYRIREFPKFILRRLCRIEPPYLVTILIYLIIKFFTKDTISWIEVLLHIGYLIPFFKNYHWISHIYWTLAIEFQFYIFIAILYPLLVRYNRYLSVTVCFAILLLVKIHIGGCKDLLFSYIHHFSIGIFTFLFLIKRVTIVEFTVAMILFFILGKFFISYQNAIIGFASGFSIVLLNRYNVVGSFLGKISYSLYVTHSIVLQLLFNLLGILFSPSHLVLNAIFLLLTATLCIMIAFIFYKFVESPFLKLSKRISYQ